MLEIMRRIARYRSEKLPQYLLTHPDPEARLHYIQTLLDNEQEAGKTETSDTENFEFFRCKYRILADLDDIDQFKNFLASVLADDKASVFAKTMASYGMSQVAKNESDFDRSRDLLEEVMEYFPEKNILQVDKGVLEFASGRLTEAETILRGALRIDGGDLYATFTLARLLSRTGRMDEAEPLFLAVSYQLPEYPHLYFELGQIASMKKQAGLAALYLAKFDLYGGKLKLAEQSLKNALRDRSLSEKSRNEAKALLKKIQLLKK